MTLEWRPHPDGNSLITVCGRYSVSLYHEQWSAWKLVPGGAWFAPLEQQLESEAAACAVAEADVEAKVSTQA